MGAIMHVVYSIEYSEWNIFVFWLKCHRFVSTLGLIDIMQQLVQALTWHHTGDRPLVEAVTTKILLPYSH